MNAEMIAALRELEREKGIAFETILQGLEEAMAAAYKSAWKQDNPNADDDFVGFRAEIDPETGEMRMFQQDLDEVEAEDGETLVMEVRGEAEVEVTDDFKGRIGAQTAKQVIFQKLRDAEREMTYEEFAGREGDIVTGIVQQSERRGHRPRLHRRRRSAARRPRAARGRRRARRHRLGERPQGRPAGASSGRRPHTTRRATRSIE